MECVRVVHISGGKLGQEQDARGSRAKSRLLSAHSLRLADSVFLYCERAFRRHRAGVQFGV